MIKYIVKRLLLLIPVLIGITFLSFAMMRLAGGDAVTYMYENAGAAVSQEVIDETRKEYGLDQPFLVQYAKWFTGMATGDMGTSYVSKRDVYDRPYEDQVIKSMSVDTQGESFKEPEIIEE